MIGAVLPVGVSRFPDADAFAHLDLQSPDHRKHSLCGHLSQGSIDNGIVVMKAREEDLQKIMANLTDRALGGKIG